VMSAGTRTAVPRGGPLFVEPCEESGRRDHPPRFEVSRSPVHRADELGAAARM